MRLSAMVVRFCMCGLLLASTSLAAAELAPPTSRLTLEAGLDSAEASEAYADVDLGLDNGLHLRGLYGGSQTTSDGEELQTTSWLVGISTNYSAPLVGGYDYEYWGDGALLETRTNRFKLGANTDNWYVQLSYELRQTRIGTTVSTSLPGAGAGKANRLSQGDEVDSNGVGLNVSYYGGYPWAVSLAYLRYSYDRDVTDLADNNRFTQAFSIADLGLASSLESWRASADVSYMLMWGSIGGSVAQSESAIDQTDSTTAAAYLIWDLHRSWSLGLTGGQYYTENPSDTISFGRVAITHRW